MLRSLVERKALSQQAAGALLKQLQRDLEAERQEREMLLLELSHFRDQRINPVYS